MPQAGRCLRILVSCMAALSFSISSHAETCNAAADNAGSFGFTQAPASALKPGIAQHVIVHVTNTSATQTWYGEGHQPYPYRLGAAFNGANPNQLIWSNFACNGLANAGQVTNQRVYMCSGATVPPGGTYEFSFDVTAPQGATGSTIDLGLQMVVEAGSNCDGWFGPAVHVGLALDAGSSVPPAPSNLGASAGNARVDLSWGGVNGADGYYVFRSAGSGCCYLNVANITGTQYGDTSVSNGTTYYYIVTAHNAAGQSARSNEVNATPSSGVTVPSAPTGLGDSGADGRVNLFWNGVNGASEYKIGRSTTSGCCYSLVTTTSGTQYSDAGLSNGTTYYYVVKAGNSAGESGLSNQASATPTSGVSAPPAPSGLSANAGDGRIDLSWNNVGGASEYRIYRGTTSGCCYSFLTSTSNTLFTDTSVSNGTTYYYVVQAHNTVGDSGYSSQAFGTPTSGVSVPPAPSGLSASGGDGRVELSWSAGSTNEFQVYRSTSAGCCYSFLSFASTNRYTDTGVTNGTEYFYVVKAHNSAGDSQPSNEARATPQARVPTLPTINIDVIRPDGTVMPAGTTLGLNTDGWPTPNPLQIRVTLNCPAGRSQGCDEGLNMDFASTDNLGRMYIVADEHQCLLAVGNVGDPKYSYMNWVCNGGAMAANESRVFVFKMIVQPSKKTAITFNAKWGSLNSAASQLSIPLAHIHPVIVIPGILGTMPPWAHVGELDPVLGVYEPLMTQLGKMGYNGQTAFRMPYDWRRSNRITARYLRDRIKETQAAAASVEWVDHNSTKVDLIVHSMGGLVTRSYVQGE